MLQMATEMDEDNMSNNSDMENVEMTNIENNSDIKMEVIVDELKSERKSPAEKSESYSNVSSHGNRSWTMAKVQVGYDITRKGERSLVVDGYKFTKSRDGTNNRVFWRCSRRECKATAVTVCDRVEHVRAIHQHDPPLAAEFFSGNLDQNSNGSTNPSCMNGSNGSNCTTVGNSNYPVQRCELQEVRFNTTAANIRGGGSHNARRRTVSKSEVEMPDDMSEKLVIGTEMLSGSTQTQPTAVAPFVTVSNPTVKEQVREYILRNTTSTSGGTSTAPAVIVPPTLSSAASNNLQSQKVAVTQFLIAQPQQQQQQSMGHHQSATQAPQIMPLINHQLNSAHLSENKLSSTEMNNAIAPPSSTMPSNTNSSHDNSNTQIEQLLHMLLNNNNNNNGSNHVSNSQLVQKLLSNHNNVAPTMPQTPSIQHQKQQQPHAELYQTLLQQQQQQQQNHHTNLHYNHHQNQHHTNLGGQNRSTPVHWKKERLKRDSESHSCCDKPALLSDLGSRKRKSPEPLHNLNSSSPPSSAIQLGQILESFRPSITAKLIGVVQKLGADLSVDSVVPQDVFEKCTAIKTCLETLEKLHCISSLSSYSSSPNPSSIYYHPSASLSSSPSFTPPQTS